MYLEENQIRNPPFSRREKGEERDEKGGIK